MPYFPLSDNAEYVQLRYWHVHTLAPWFTEKLRLMTEAASGFGEVAKMHVPEWELAASARAGDLQYDMVRKWKPLWTRYDKDASDAEIRETVQWMRDIFLAPYLEGAVKAYGHCSNVSRKVRWFDGNSLHCESRLSELEPEEFPPMDEMRPNFRPSGTYRHMAVPKPILNWEQTAAHREKSNDEGADGVWTNDVEPLAGASEAMDLPIPVR